MAGFGKRMLGAAKLDVHTYEEVEADAHALPQAMGVVVLASVAAGIGTGGREGAPNLLLESGVALASWFLWAGLTYLIGTKILPTPETKADLGQLLRTTGFSAAPGVLRLVALVPSATQLILLGAHLWMLAAFVVAVRQALDYASTWRALVVCALGWFAHQLLMYFMVSPVPLEVARALGEVFGRG